MLQGNTYLSRLRFASLLFKPIWRRLVTVPFALLGVAAFIRDEILPSDSIAKLKLSDVLPAWPWEWFALAFLVLVLIIASESCFRMMREKDKRILLYEEAWDRTDKFLVPINEVLATLVDRLPFPAATSEDRKYELAAAKIREIGADGQMRIVGHRLNAAVIPPILRGLWK